jgi:hypothetical protein
MNVGVPQAMYVKALYPVRPSFVRIIRSQVESADYYSVVRTNKYYSNALKNNSSLFHVTPTKADTQSKEF